MKKLITIAMLLLIVIACKEENNPLSKIKEVTNTVKEAKQGFGNVNEVIKGVEGLEKNIKKLSELTPITKEQIKAWMPTELGDLKRSSFQISKEMGVKFKLVFKGEDNKNLNINIIDGAGSGSPVIAMYNMMQKMDIDKENDSGYERTQKIDEQPMLVKYQSSGNYEKSTIQCTLNGRFGIEANAKGMTPEKLWEYIQELQIEKLIN
jgi:hypothetical protein